MAFLMCARELSRSRFVLLLLLVVPTVFYAIVALVSPETELAFELANDVVITVPQLHEAMVFIGLASVGVLTSFVALSLLQRDPEASRRLLMCGYRPGELVLARLGVLACVTVAVATYVVAALPLFFTPERLLGLWLGFVLCGWVYGGWGLLVGALVRRELEGILLVVLLANIDVGWLQNPVYYADAQNQVIIRALPAYFPSQVAMAAAFSDEAIGRVAGGAAVYGLGLVALAVGAYGWRMTRR